MSKISLPNMAPVIRICVTGMIFAAMASAHAADSNVASAASLRAKFAALQGQLTQNQFDRPLYLNSSETTESVTGDIHAVFNYPFGKVSAALTISANWCEIMILHLNTKYCRTSAGKADVLNVSVGKKFDQSLADAYRVVFVFSVAAQTGNYMQILMVAEEGPLSTRDYRIMLQAIPLDAGQTFIHLSYSYSYGPVGRIAMQAYLNTVAMHKVGFTIVSREAQGRSRYVGGMRGLVERNTMRYYVAIEAFLGSLSMPQEARFESSLHDWFAGIERYPQQLHEMDRMQYFEMKRKEYARQQISGR